MKLLYILLGVICLLSVVGIIFYVYSNPSSSDPIAVSYECFSFENDSMCRINMEADMAILDDINLPSALLCNNETFLDCMNKLFSQGNCESIEYSQINDYTISTSAYCKEVK